MSNHRTLRTLFCLASLAGVTLGLFAAGQAGAATGVQSQGVVDLRYAPEDGKPLQGLALEENTTTGLDLGQTVCLAFDPASTEVLAGGTEINRSGIKEGSVIRVNYLCPAGAAIAFGCACAATRVQVVEVRGIWRHSLTFGVEFSQERGDFSEQDAILGFSTDTLLKQWGQTNKNRFHSHLEVGLVAVPNEQTSSPATDGEDGSDGQQPPPGNGSEGELETFLASRKSISMQVGGYWVRELRRGDDVLNLGLVGKYGFHSLANHEEEQGADDPVAAATEDTVKSFYAAGFRFAHHKQVPPGVNPEILRSVEVLVGHYENFLSKSELAALGVENPKDQRLRVVIDGRLRLPGKMPVYTGMLANLGEGKDDVRLFVALRFDIEKLAALLPKP